MPRKGIKTAKVVKPNLERLVNNVMMHGKKRKAENIVQKALDHVIKHLPAGYEMPEEMAAHKDANNVLQLKIALVDEVIEAVRPLVMVKSQRIGGANLQVPRDVPMSEGISKSHKWIDDSTQKRCGHNGS